jgi:hypothetical protein
MNKLVLLYSALRHPAGRADSGVATPSNAKSFPAAHRHDRHDLACAWRIDPTTGRLGCVWSQS